MITVGRRLDIWAGPAGYATSPGYAATPTSASSAMTMANLNLIFVRIAKSSAVEHLSQRKSIEQIESVSCSDDRQSVIVSIPSKQLIGPPPHSGQPDGQLFGS